MQKVHFCLSEEPFEGSKSSDIKEGVIFCIWQVRKILRTTWMEKHCPLSQPFLDSQKTTTNDAAAHQVQATTAIQD